MWLLYFPPPVLFITSRAKKKKNQPENVSIHYSAILESHQGAQGSHHRNSTVHINQPSSNYITCSICLPWGKKKNHRKWWRETTTSAAHGTASSPCSPGGEAGCRRGRGCKRVAGIRDAELTRHVKGTDGDETFGKVRQLTSDWFTPSPSTLFIYVADGRHKFHCGSQRYKPNSISQPVC